MANLTQQQNSFCEPAIYTRRRPDRTLLHQLVKKHFQDFDQSANKTHSSKTVPPSVRREFEDYLNCGRLEKGFIKLACTECSRNTLVAFSCKRRGFCPSCGARRMSQTAAHLVDKVLPLQPYRQWVLSLPYPLRFLVAREPEVLSLTLSITYKVIARFLTQSTAPTKQQAHTGGVAVVQRFGSALNLNPHFHMLMLDGVYYNSSSGQLKFKQACPPTQAQIQQITVTIAQRVAKALVKSGHLVCDEQAGHYLPDQVVDLLGDLQSHSITYRIATGPRRGQKVFQLQLIEPCEDNGQSASDPVANYAGFNLHAGLKIGSKRRDKLERLCRYISRPPLAQARLTLTEENKVAYRLKSPFRNGTTHIIFESDDFISKLSALIPPPRANLTRYFGVFAPASNFRSQIIPNQENVKKTTLCTKSTTSNHRYIPWASLLKRVFKIDVEKCTLCGGRVEVVEIVTEQTKIEVLLSDMEEAGQLDRSEPTFEQIAQGLRGPPELLI